MPEQMSASQQAQFCKSMEDQGVVVMRTTKGFFLRLPNGESTVAHFTNSDARANQNLFGILRRAGVRHPEDPKNVAELPKDITAAQPVAERTKRKITETIAKLDYPSRITMKDLTEHVDIAHITASRALYQMGFKPVKGKRNSRDWLVPDDILALKPVPEVEAEVEAIEEDVAESPTFSEPKPKAFHDNSTEREFIDTHDSWTVDLGRISPYVTVQDYIENLLSAGLEAEIRVWRA